MRVLLGTDGSDDAIAAASRALGLLAPADEVIVVCIVEPPSVATAGLESGFAGGVAAPELVEEAWAAARTDAAAMLERTVAALQDTPGTITSLAEAGSPGATLCRLAEQHHADVVVVGSRGRGAIKRALLGSVSTHVVNHSPSPVLVLRADAG